jgi:2-polyprenyl-3-methyl-5-hydroxy-6-metoxy-1,4-benzoquinol methylase
MKKFDYENQQYLDKLNDLKLSYYSKYVSFIKKYLKSKNSKFLDVGCGNGAVLKLIESEGYKSGYGVDVSRLFLQEGKKQGLKNLFYYGGTKLPFKDNNFDLVGSFNVLEHTKEPEDFIKDEIRTLKKGGILIVACPNFISVLFPSYHRRLKGVKNKSRNLYLIIKKIFSKELKFERMKPVIQKVFQYDDDAIVVTNLIELKRIVKKEGCEIIYESGFINYDTLIFKAINTLPLIKYLLPSCFIVARKNT